MHEFAPPGPRGGRRAPVPENMATLGTIVAETGYPLRKDHKEVIINMPFFVCYGQFLYKGKLAGV